MTEIHRKTDEALKRFEDEIDIKHAIVKEKLRAYREKTRKLKERKNDRR